MTNPIIVNYLDADKRRGRHRLFRISMTLSALAFAGEVAATQVRVDGVLTTCKATASTTADPLQGILGNLKADYQQMLTSANSSSYPATGSCNVCHGTGSAKGNDAAANKAQASNANYAFFCGVANAAPALTLTPATDQAITEGTTKTIVAKATDPNKDPVTVTVTPSPLPSGASFDGTTLTYTPPLGTAAQTPKVAFTFVATDKPASGTALSSPAQTITFNVSAPTQPTNNPPVVPSTTWSVTMGDATTYTFDVTATDADKDPLTLTTSKLPDGMTFTADVTDSSIGHFSWAPNGPAAPGTTLVTVTASDKSAQSSGTLTVNVNAATTPGTGVVTSVRVRAFWMQRASKLFVGGRVVAPKGTNLTSLKVTVTDATAGTVLGTADVNARGGWGLVLTQPATVPCTVTATVDGKSASQNVGRAPSTCPTATTNDNDRNTEANDDDKAMKALRNIQAPTPKVRSER